MHSEEVRGQHYSLLETNPSYHVLTYTLTYCENYKVAKKEKYELVGCKTAINTLFVECSLARVAVGAFTVE